VIKVRSLQILAPPLVLRNASLGIQMSPSMISMSNVSLLSVTVVASLDPSLHQMLNWTPDQLTLTLRSRPSMMIRAIKSLKDMISLTIVILNVLMTALVSLIDSPGKLLISVSM
jgi:hypothetical protein